MFPTSDDTWTASFLTSGSVTVKATDERKTPHLERCNTPQGSLSIPILFMLHISSFLRDEAIKPARLASAACKLMISPSLRYEAPQRMLDQTLCQGGSKGITYDPAKAITFDPAKAITFDPAKAELILFSWKREDLLPPIKLRNEALTPKDSITWLGVILDSRLTFKQHVQAQPCDSK